MKGDESVKNSPALDIDFLIAYYPRVSAEIGVGKTEGGRPWRS